MGTGRIAKLICMKNSNVISKRGVGIGQPEECKDDCTPTRHIKKPRRRSNKGFFEKKKGI